MLNIVIATHGNLGPALIQAAEMIAGPLHDIYAISIEPGESPEIFEHKLETLLEQIKEGDILFLIDLIGGTPYNIIAHQLQSEHIACVTGVNLPMLLELVVKRNHESSTANDLAQDVTEVGIKGIRNLGAILKRR